MKKPKQLKMPETLPDTAAIIEKLKAVYPEAICSLEYGGDPWKLLVAARLSAQCTDERVNVVCGPLFERFPDAVSVCEGRVEEIEGLIKSCGLYRGKAKSIFEFSRDIVEKFGGRVPDNMEDLLSLSGVGRKIANLILGDIFGKGGIVADTHCMRICGRLGFYHHEKKDPLFTERVMEKLIPVEEQSDFCHRMVLFGREYCDARKPRCTLCPLKHLCLFENKTTE